MGVGARLYMYVVVVQKFTFAISSPDEFLLYKGYQPMAASHMLSLLTQPVRDLLLLYTTTKSNTVAQPGEYVGIYDYSLPHGAQV